MELVLQCVSLKGTLKIPRLNPDFRAPHRSLILQIGNFFVVKIIFSDSKAIVHKFKFENDAH